MTEVAPDTKKKVLQDISAAYGLSEPTLNQEWEKWSQQQTTAGLKMTASVAKIKAWFMDHLTSQGMVTVDDDNEDHDDDDAFPILDAGEYESGDEDGDDSLDFLNDTTDAGSSSKLDMFKRAEARVLQRMQDEFDEDAEFSKAKAYDLPKAAAAAKEKNLKVTKVGDLLDRLDLGGSHEEFAAAASFEGDSEKVTVESLLAHIGLETCPISGRLQASSSSVIHQDFAALEPAGRVFGSKDVSDIGVIALRTWARSHGADFENGGKAGTQMAGFLAQTVQKMDFRGTHQKSRARRESAQQQRNRHALIVAQLVMIIRDSASQTVGQDAKAYGKENLQIAVAEVQHDTPAEGFFLEDAGGNTGGDGGGDLFDDDFGGGDGGNGRNVTDQRILQTKIRAAKSAKRSVMNKKTRQLIRKGLLAVAKMATNVSKGAVRPKRRDKIYMALQRFGRQVTRRNKNDVGGAKAASNFGRAALVTYVDHFKGKTHGTYIKEFAIRQLNKAMGTVGLAYNELTPAQKRRHFTPLPRDAEAEMPRISAASKDLSMFLTEEAAAYLRRNPSLYKRAGTRYALLVPAEASCLAKVKAGLKTGADSIAKYVRGALLARHPHAAMDSQGHLLSLSGTVFRLDISKTHVVSDKTKGLAVKVQQMQRKTPSAHTAEDDVWDAEALNAGSTLIPHANRLAMKCIAGPLQVRDDGTGKDITLQPLYYWPQD